MISTLFNEFSQATVWAALLLGASLGLGVLLIFTRPSKKKTSQQAFTPRFDAHEALPVENEDPDLLEANTIHKGIADLMVRDEWIELADRIAAWEAELASTPGGLRYHDIALDVALSGLQSLIDDAERNTLDDLSEAQRELAHFMDSHVGTPDNHVLACLAARAQMMVGYACRPEFWPEGIAEDAWRTTARHFIAAGEILGNFDALEHMSPILAEARYLQAQGSPSGLQQLPTLFDEWIGLDPANPAIYSAHVPHLSPERLGSEEALRDGADAALARTEETHGYAGYSFFFLPILHEMPEYEHLMDPELFAMGFLDLAERSGSQAEVNWAAATLAQIIDRADGDAQMVMQETFYILVRRHMSVIYPRIWAHDLGEVEARLEAAAIAAPDIMPETDSGLRYAAAA